MQTIGDTVEVVDLVRAGVAGIAPEELPLFDNLARAWLDGHLGGAPAALDTGLVFETVTGTLAAALGEATYARVRSRPWPWRKEKPQATVAIDPAHRAALHLTCLIRAQERGLSRRKAELLADVLFG